MSTSSLDADQEGDKLKISALVTENNNLKMRLQVLLTEEKKLKEQLNYKGQKLKNMCEFYKSEQLCDIILVANDGKKFAVHKLILASQNKRFIELFFKSKHITEILLEVNSQTLQSILLYMYDESEIVVDGCNLEDLLNGAFFFNIDYIKSICLNFIESKGFEEDGLWNSWLKHEHDMKFNDWICLAIGNKFCKLTESMQTLLYAKLSGQNLINIINHEDFACPDEKYVYDFIIRWIKFDDNNRKIYIHNLMNLVKIPFLSKEYQLKMLNEPLLNDYMTEVNIRMKEVLVTTLSEHMDQYDKYKNNSNFKRRLPRSLGEPNVIVAISTNGDNKVEQMHVKDGEPWEWTQGNTMFTPRHNSAMIVVFGQAVLYAIGGITDDKKPTNNVDFLDLSFYWQKWIPTTPMKHARQCFAVCTDRENIYAIGGKDVDGKILDSMEVFNVQSGLWNVVKMNVARYFHSAVHHNGCIYIVGGIRENVEIIGSIQRYNTNSGHWSEITTPHKLIAPCTVGFNNTLFAIGGVTKQNGELQFLNSIHELDLDSEQWTKSPYLKPGRFLGSAVIIDRTYLFVFGGFYDVKKQLQKTEIFRINENKPYLSSIQMETNTTFGGKYQGVVLSDKLLFYTKIIVDRNK